MSKISNLQSEWTEIGYPLVLTAGMMGILTGLLSIAKAITPATSLVVLIGIAGMFLLGTWLMEV